ncbi:MAG: phosphate--acyl-ACP acyltransferase, partial [Firmicutes bacterium]|nr:phosphate--acyl-ACP acyltransferase [Bacillota bacterium]
MRIIIDGMGGDNAPEAICEGAVMAAKETEHEIVLVGNEEILRELVTKYQGRHPVENISFVNAGESITNNDAPAL